MEYDIFFWSCIVTDRLVYCSDKVKAATEAAVFNAIKEMTSRYKRHLNLQFEVRNAAS